MLALIEFYLALGKKTEASALHDELRKKYNRSPEYILADLLLDSAKDKKIIIDFYPLPYRYLGAVRPAEKPHVGTSTQPAETRDPSPAPVGNEYSICVGSFRVYENADARLQELTAKGIKTRITEKQIKGKQYFRVVIVGEYSYTQAKEFISRLSHLGFTESFLIKE